MHFDHMSGVIPPLIFVLLLEGKAGLFGCGEVTMPSSEMMAQAPPEVIKRFESVKEVKLSGMENLAGGSYQYVAHRYFPTNRPGQRIMLVMVGAISLECCLKAT